MNFNFDNERPIYIQLVEKLRTIIVSGVYKSGDRLPSVRELALMAKVNPNTMQKALLELESDGLIYTERTNGKFVTENIKLIEKVRRDLAKSMVNEYISNMEKLGITFDESVTYLQELGGRKWYF